MFYCRTKTGAAVFADVAGGMIGVAGASVVKNFETEIKICVFFKLYANK